MNLCDDLFRRGEEAPDRLGLIFEDGRRFTFGQMHRLCIAAGDLLKKLDIGPGDRVALKLQNSPELVFLIFGAWSIGAVPVMLNVMYKIDEVTHSLEKSEPKLLLTSDEATINTLRLQFPGLGIELFGSGRRLESLMVSQPNAAVPYAAEAGSEAVILFTGGSTGAPKAVSITHDGFAKSVSVQAAAAKGGRTGPFPLAAESSSPNIVAVPLFHMLGQKQLLFAFHVGRSVILLERFQPEVFLRLAREHGVDNFVLLPTMVFDMANAEENLDLSGVKHVLVGGQPLATEVRRKFEQRFNVPILSIYGSTEAGSIAGWTASDVRDGKWKPGSVGRIFPGVELKIVAADGIDIPQGEIGEIWVRAKIARGYLDSTEGSLLKEGGWVATGDLGFLDSEGVLFLSGRQREIIKTGGFQVFPAEIEDVLRQHPLVKDIAVLGVADPRLGEVPKAFVVLNEQANSEEAVIADLIRYSKEKLASFKSVKSIKIVQALPRNDIGKVEKHRLMDA